MTMLSSDTPRVESFVLRFIEDSPRLEMPSATRSWHGVILHVQTNEEKTFAHFADAVAFMARYVSIGDFVFPPAADDQLQIPLGDHPSTIGDPSGV